MAERRVLVVEDDDSIRAVVTEFLRDEGYEVRAAHNGREALDALLTWRPDAIVLDLMMPVMDGWDFRAAQRALPDGLNEIPVIILSARHDAPTHAVALEAAATIPKPFNLDDIIAGIEQALRKGAS